MKTIFFRWIAGEKNSGYKYIKHDFRLYANLPPHIMKKMVFDILYCDGELKEIINTKTNTLDEKVSRIREYYNKLYDRQLEIFNRLKNAGIISKNLDFNTNKLTLHGVIACSRELRQEIEQDEEKRKKFIKDVKLMIGCLAALLGTEILYIVDHKDESTLNIHFALLNLRTKPQIELAPMFGLSDDEVKKLEKGTGKTITGTFVKNYFKDKLRDYQFTYSTLQDWIYNFFRYYLNYDIERGIHKEARIMSGEPWFAWKHINPHLLSSPILRKRYAEYLLKKIFEEQEKEKKNR